MTSTLALLMRSALALLVLAVALPANAAIKVLATTADWGALTTELGGDQVNVYVATSALQDVHRVDAKPSLVARARTADLVVASGAELEIGWLPVLIQESGNSRIQHACADKPGVCRLVSAAAAAHQTDLARHRGIAPDDDTCPFQVTQSIGVRQCHSCQHIADDSVRAVNQFFHTRGLPLPKIHVFISAVSLYIISKRAALKQEGILRKTNFFHRFSVSFFPLYSMPEGSFLSCSSFEQTQTNKPVLLCKDQS